MSADDHAASVLQEKMMLFSERFKKWIDDQNNDISGLQRDHMRVIEDGEHNIRTISSQIDEHQETIRKQKDQARADTLQLNALQKDLQSLRQEAKLLPQLSSTLDAEITRLEGILTQRRLERTDDVAQLQQRLNAAQTRVSAFESTLGIRVVAEHGMLNFTISHVHPGHPDAQLTFVAHMDPTRRCRVFQCVPALPGLSALADELAKTGDIARFVQRARREFRAYLEQQ